MSFTSKPPGGLTSLAKPTVTRPGDAGQQQQPPALSLGSSAASTGTSAAAAGASASAATTTPSKPTLGGLPKPSFGAGVFNKPAGATAASSPTGAGTESKTSSLFKTPIGGGAKPATTAASPSGESKADGADANKGGDAGAAESAGAASGQSSTTAASKPTLSLGKPATGGLTLGSKLGAKPAASGTSTTSSTTTSGGATTTSATTASNSAAAGATTTTSGASGTSGTTTTSSTGINAGADPTVRIKSLSVADIFELWTNDLDAQVAAFVQQAAEVRKWEVGLREDGSRIIGLQKSAEAVSQTQRKVSQLLESLKVSQEELERQISRLEKMEPERKRLGPDAARRESVYKVAEAVDEDLTQLNQMLDDVSESLTRTQSRLTEGNAPLETVTKVINAQVSAIQWVSNTTDELEARVTDAIHALRASRHGGARHRQLL